MTDSHNNETNNPPDLDTHEPPFGTDKMDVGGANRENEENGEEDGVDDESMDFEKDGGVELMKFLESSEFFNPDLSSTTIKKGKEKEKERPEEKIKAEEEDDETDIETLKACMFPEGIPDDKSTILKNTAEDDKKQDPVVMTERLFKVPPRFRFEDPIFNMPTRKQDSITTDDSTAPNPTPLTPFKPTSNTALARFEQEYGPTLDNVLAPSSSGVGKNMDFVEMKERFKISFSEGFDSVMGVQRGLKRLLREQELDELEKKMKEAIEKKEDGEGEEGTYNVVGAGVTPFRRMLGGFRESLRGRQLFTGEKREHSRITEVDEDEEERFSDEDFSEDASEEEEEKEYEATALRASHSQMVLFFRRSASSIRNTITVDNAKKAAASIHRTITVDNAKATFQHSLHFIHTRSTAFKRPSLWELIILIPLFTGFLYLTIHKITLYLTPEPAILIRSSDTTYDSNGLPLLTPLRTTPFHFADTPSPPSLPYTILLTLLSFTFTLFRHTLTITLTHILPVLALLLLLTLTCLHPSLSAAYSGAPHPPLISFHSTYITPLLTTLRHLLHSISNLKHILHTAILTLSATLLVGAMMALYPLIWTIRHLVEGGIWVWRVTKGERFWWAAAVCYWGALGYGAERVGWDLMMRGVEGVRGGICDW